jgi:hypothetical protein
VIGLALSAARVLGKSRALAVFGGLVAVAGIVNELQRRREQGSEAGAEG